MIIRNHPIAPRRGNEPPAQGNALGKERRNNRPERAKAMLSDKAFALSGRTLSALYPGRCPGLLARWPFRPPIGYMRIIILADIARIAEDIEKEKDTNPTPNPSPTGAGNSCASSPTGAGNGCA